MRARRNETVKWLVQNQTSRSRNGAGVVSALPSCAAASWRNTARRRATAPVRGRFSRSSRSAVSPAALGRGICQPQASGPLQLRPQPRRPDRRGEARCRDGPGQTASSAWATFDVHTASLHAMLVSHSDKGLKEPASQIIARAHRAIRLSLQIAPQRSICQGESAGARSTRGPGAPVVVMEAHRAPHAARQDPQYRHHRAYRRGQDHDDRADPVLHRHVPPHR